MVTATVLVLGDIGRSPRMQYHCMSLASEGVSVNIVANSGKPCCEEVESNEKIHKYLLPPSPFNALPRKLFILYAPFKVLYQIFQLLFLLLFKVPKPDFYLVQNPPTIPTLMIVWLASRIQGAKFYIDWHNFGYTILGLSLGHNHFLVQLAKWLEYTFGRLSDGNLCVTAAMQEWLIKEWGIQASVLYDRAPSFFRRISIEEKHTLFQRVLPNLGIPCDDNETPFTVCDSTGIHSRKDRPALLVSSTSWTPDEDFQLLLRALEVLEQTFDPSDGVRVVCIVTGIGPLRSFFESRISELALQHIRICTLWLEAADYPLLLGAADLGVCLHSSSSGLDLPMKVVDMFGAGLPVCALDFHCLGELVRNGENGVVFEDSTDLCQALKELLEEFPENEQKLEKLREGVERCQTTRWEENWKLNAKPVLFKYI